MNIPEDALEKLLQNSDKSRTVLLNLLEDQHLKVNELRESQLKYESLFENSPVSLWEEDFSEVQKFLNEHCPIPELVETYLDDNPDKIHELVALVKVIDINQATLKLYKANSKDQLTKGLASIFTTDSLDIFKKLIIGFSQKISELETETVNKNLAGEILQIKLKYAVLPGYEETLERVIVSIIDITQEKEIKEKLLQSEQRFIEAQAVARFGNWYIDYKKNTITRSQEIFNILETTEKELKPTFDSFKQLIQKDDFEEYKKVFEESIKKQKPYEFSFRIITPKGNVKYVLEKGQTFYDEHNQPLRTVGTLQDITEKVHAEHQIKESQLQYQVLFDNAPIALFEEDFTEVIQKLMDLGAASDTIDTLLDDADLLQQCMQLIFVNNANQESLKLFKADSKEHFHQFLPNLFTKHAVDIVKNIFIDITQGKTNGSYETTLRMVDGELFNALVRFSVLKYKKDSGKLIFSVENITLRKKLLEEINDKQENLNQAQKIALIGSFTLNHADNSIIRTDEFYRIFETTVEKLPTREECFLSFVHPEDSKQLVTAFRNSIKNKNPYELVYRITTGKGNLKYIHEKGNTYYNEKDEPLKTIGTLQDITEKILFENELDKSRKTLEKTLFNMTDGFIHINKNWEYTFVNPQAAKFLHQPIDVLLGAKIWDVFPDIINKGFYSNCKEVLATQKPMVYEEHFKEHQRWFENRIYPSTDGLSIFFNDITDRKNIEKRTKEAHNVIINSNSIAIVWENIPTWPIKYVSENIERILGYSAGEMTDEIIHFSKIMHPDDLEISNEEAFLYLKDADAEQYNLSPYRVFTKEGKIRWIAERTNIIRNEKNEIIELRGFIDDITEQHQLENAINSILSSVSKVTGNEYLKEITIQLSNVLGADHTFIGLNETENLLIINTLFNCYKGEIVDNFSYNLKGTPCADVLELSARSFAGNVANLFPKDVLLAEMGIEGYVGVPLLDSHNHPIGIMVALFKSPIENILFAESIIQLFSTRTSAEIERLRTEEKLKESEAAFNKQLQKLNLAIDSVNDVVFMTDPDGIFTYVNKEFTQLYGYELDEVIGKLTPRILKSGYYTTKFYKKLWSQLLKNHKFNLKFLNKSKDGTLINLETSLNAVTNEQGEIIGFIAIQRDITEKIKQNQLLELSEKKYRDLFEKSEDATLLIKNNLFVDCNLATLKMLNYKGAKENFLNVHPSKISPLKQPDGRFSSEKADEMMNLALEKGSHKFEWLHLKSNNEDFYAEVTLTKIVSDTDHFIHVIWRDITENKKAEEQLKASEAEGWSLFEEAPYPIWIEDFSKIKQYFNKLKQKGITDLRKFFDENPQKIEELAQKIVITKVNRVSLLFYNVSSKAELIRHITDFFVEESYQVFKEELIALFEGKTSFQSEIPIRKLDGQMVVLIINISIPDIYKDTLEKVIISFNDITEQKRNEQTKEVLLNITKQISDVTSIKSFSAIVKNELGNLLDTSNFYIALYNQEKDTISIPYFIDDLDGEFEDKDEFEAEGTLTNYVIKTKKPLLATKEGFTNLEESGHIKLVGSDSEIWLGVPLFAKNEVIGAIAVQSYTNPEAYTIHDQKILEIVAEQIAIAIERIQYQNAIKENEEKFRTIFELSPDMVNLVAIDGTLLDCNDAFVKQLGYNAKEELIGKSIIHLIQKENRKAAIEKFYFCLTTGQVHNQEFKVIKKDGSEFSVEISATLNYDENKLPKNLIGITRDITERKKYEDFLNLALEKAKEADRLKSAFLANMSHEIRTPMNGIIGFAEMLQSQDLNEEKRSFYANIIMNSSRQLLSIINDVLDMSTIEAGLAEIKKAPVSINEMLAELHEFFLQKTDEKGIKLTCELTLMDELSVINTDRTKVQQILTNFISNAIKFTKKGGVAFGYTLKNDFLEFYVTDTGIGIDKKLHHEIFERFRQVNMEYTRETIGNGLGLSISKKLVELLGGEIWLESEPKKGSTFYFTLPYQHDVLEVIEENIKQTTYIAMNEQITILLAEDEEYNRIFIEEILDDKNFIILTAENGVEAVDTAKNHPEIKFILMDIKMPIMNGIEALKAIKIFNKTVPIVALTAFSMESDKNHLMSEGFDDYAAKPIVKKDLMRIIEKYVHSE
ncbi:MAG: PAS domain S-box protein [Flavobacteriaceae bacterium]|nr:PAS domain S-box protein [Flavobacteriaceae bacterium]